jgi:hypothetical protein
LLMFVGGADDLAGRNWHGLLWSAGVFGISEKRSLLIIRLVPSIEGCRLPLSFGLLPLLVGPIHRR